MVYPTTDAPSGVSARRLASQPVFAPPETRSDARLRVMQLVVSLDKAYGGPPVVAAGFSTALAGLSHASSIWTIRSAGGEPRLKPAGVEVRDFALCGSRKWYRSPEMARRLRELDGEQDLIHVHEIWSHPQYAAATAAIEYDIPYLITPHGELDHRHLRHGGPLKQLKKRLYLKLLGNRILRNAACLHALNTSEAEELIEAGFCKSVTVIPNGINLEEFDDLPAPDAAEEIWPELRGKRVVLFLSRLSPEKGLDQLIPAWRAVQSRPSFSDTVLVVAGPDGRGYERIVREMVQEHEVGGSALFTGMVTGFEKLALMARADIYTLPSHSEGFSMSVLENLAVGTPVLITPGCNFPEVVTSGAGVCVGPRPDRLFEGLRQLLDLSEEDRRAMGERGRNLVASNYTWDVQARKMLNVYRCILSGKEIPLYPQPVAS